MGVGGAPEAGLVGATLDGRYEVTRELGHGGMATVYLAEDVRLKRRRVVVKQPRPGLFDAAELRRRFGEEIQQLIQRPHAHIVEILDQGEHGGIPFYVLKYMDGGSLGARLARGLQSTEEVLRWLRPIAEALDFVHQPRRDDRGEVQPPLVHRDVKPDNVLFLGDGPSERAFLSDFGIVKVLGADLAATTANTYVGTYEYMAPEQSDPEATLTGAADQYALAGTVYRSLCGKAPFFEVPPLERPGARRFRRPQSLGSPGLAPHVAAAACAAVMRGLEAAPGDRFATCADFAAAFEAGLTGAPPSGAEPTALAPSTEARPTPSRRRRARRLAVGAVLGLCLLAAGYFFFLRDRSSETAPVPLSEAAREVLARVPEGTRVQVFWGSPGNVTPSSLTEGHRRTLERLLQSMETARPRLRVEWVDVATEEGRRLAESSSVESYEVREVVGDEMRVRKEYSSLIVSNHLREPFRLEPLLEMSDFYEYRVTEALHEMTTGAKTVVALLLPPVAAADGLDRFALLRGALAQPPELSVRTDLSLDAPVPREVSVLVLVAPRGLTEPAVFHLEQFALRGGRVLILLDGPTPYPFDGTPSATFVASGLEAWLAGFGVEVEEAVVADTESGSPAPRQGKEGAEFVAFPYWPRITHANVDRTLPIGLDLVNVSLLWPVPLSASAGTPAPGGLSTVALATTGPKGRRETDLAVLTTVPEESPEGERIPLVLFVGGPAVSRWKGRPPPEGAGEEAVRSRIENGRCAMVLVGNAEFVADNGVNQRLRQLGYGRGFALTYALLTWLRGTDRMLEMRASTEPGA